MLGVVVVLLLSLSVIPELALGLVVPELVLRLVVVLLLSLPVVPELPLSVCGGHSPWLLQPPR